MNATITEKAALIPGTSFTEAEDYCLIMFLDDVRKNKCRWPTEASTRAAHGVVSYWAAELVITRPGAQGTEILLAQYDGGIEEFKNCWHIPGGYNNPEDQGEPGSSVSCNGWGIKSIQPVVSRIAKRELGMDARVRNILDLFWWQRREEKWEAEKGQHPYGTPLSIYVQCELTGVFCPTGKIQFFPVMRLPSPIVIPHLQFIAEHLVLKEILKEKT
ncbi:MAG: hypothetical protein A3B25_03445 [Candidatus Ryanbacteria bacterium RIFCSPLOWO2_01_FULL_48_26]|uniref:Nudix hydrolase domain-containing protein n=1 Tax=Candidatus Ryanbacteria bacterium RIFCSPLOWO2_01_FULL_48_26 TaxID=1802126 RepID=A0A1G2GR59_9BACT|nr:MAG: hypothetical protein A3B25_03445 [Candidatus Ryanbacteria bacterium RIFCSPLOWO2_01_FULL_48_26]